MKEGFRSVTPSEESKRESIDQKRESVVVRSITGLEDLLRSRPTSVTDIEARWRTFFELPETEKLVGDWSAAIIKGIARQGRMYVFTDHICFYSNLFGQKETLCIPFADVIGIDKIVVNLTAGLKIRLSDKSFKFGSVYFRQKCFEQLRQLWSGSYVLAEIDEGPEEIHEIGNDDDIAEELLSNGDYSNSDKFLTGLDELQQLISEELPCTPTQFFKYFCSNESSFEKDYHIQRGDTEIDVGEWTPNTTFGVTRDVKYVIKLTGPVGPPTTRTEEIHRYHLTKERLIIDTSMNMLDAPYGDYFRVESQWVVTAKEDKKCLVKISAKAVFSKSTMLKSTISSKTLQGMTESFTLWVKLAREDLNRRHTKPGSSPAKGSPQDKGVSTSETPSVVSVRPQQRGMIMGILSSVVPSDLKTTLLLCNLITQIIMIYVLLTIARKL